MKIVFFIMAFLALALSFVPCDDIAQLNEIHNENQFSNSNHQHSHSQQDSCSPFCHCCCCSSLSFIQKINFVYPSQILEQVKTKHLTSQVFEITIPVWQPPQLG